MHDCSIRQADRIGLELMHDKNQPFGCTILVVESIIEGDESLFLFIYFYYLNSLF